MPTTFTGSGNRLGGGGGGSGAPAASAPPPVNSRPQGNCPKFDSERSFRLIMSRNYRLTPTVGAQPSKILRLNSEKFQNLSFKPKLAIFEEKSQK